MRGDEVMRQRMPCAAKAEYSIGGLMQGVWIASVNS